MSHLFSSLSDQKMRGPKDLGMRICIIGRSSSGKSSLANRLGSKLKIPVYHLDQLAHLPHTNWQRRPNPELIAAHDKIIQTDKWIIEGNYSCCMPQRFQRATFVIWLDPPVLGCLWRYIRRSLRRAPERVGGLVGAKGEFSFSLVRFTLFQYPKNRVKYKKLLTKGPPFLILSSLRCLNRLYKELGLIL